MGTTAAEQRALAAAARLAGRETLGQSVQYPKGTPHNVLLTAIAQAMGMQTNHFGGADAGLQGGAVSMVKA